MSREGCLADRSGVGGGWPQDCDYPFCGCITLRRRPFFERLRRHYAAYSNPELGIPRWQAFKLAWGLATLPWFEPAPPTLTGGRK